MKVLTGVIALMVAGILCEYFKLRPLFYSILGYRDFNRRKDIVERIKKSRYFNMETERLSEENSLIFFESPKQKTWLFVSNLNVYIVLDDIAYQKLFIMLFMPLTAFSVQEIAVDPEGFHGQGINKFFVTPKGEGFYYNLSRFPTKKKLHEMIEQIINRAINSLELFNGLFESN